MVKLVFSIQLVAIPSICEVRGESKVCFGAFLRHTKGFRAAKKSLPPPAEKGHNLIFFFNLSLRHWVFKARNHWFTSLLRYQVTEYHVSCILYHVFFILFPVSCILYPVSCILYSVSCILYPVSCIPYHISRNLYTVSYIMYPLRYAGQLLAPEEDFGLRLSLFWPLRPNPFHAIFGVQ